MRSADEPSLVWLLVGSRSCPPEKAGTLAHRRFQQHCSFIRLADAGGHTCNQGSRFSSGRARAQSCGSFAIRQASRETQQSVNQPARREDHGWPAGGWLRRPGGGLPGQTGTLSHLALSSVGGGRPASCSARRMDMTFLICLPHLQVSAQM